MTTQVNAVVEAVQAVLGEAFVAGTKVVLSPEHKAQVVSIVTEGIANGSVDFSLEARAKYDTEAKLKGYVGGMVLNHLSKCKELNGGVKHEIKNKGIRSGSDEFKQGMALKADIEARGETISQELSDFIEANRPVATPKVSTKKAIKTDLIPLEVIASVA